MSENRTVGGIFKGSARIGEIMDTFTQLTLTPQDMTSPVALQMALSRIYEAMTRAITMGPKKKYVAEVKFIDSLGNPVTIALDLGEKMPPFSNKEVKAKISIELFEEEPKEF